LTTEWLSFFPVYSYLIVYRPERHPLQVVSILHASRDHRQILRIDGNNDAVRAAGLAPGAYRHSHKIFGEFSSLPPILTRIPSKRYGVAPLGQNISFITVSEANASA